MNAEKALLSVIRGGVTYALADYMRIVSIMGAGMSPLDRLGASGPLQHGETDRGFRLRPRVIRLVGIFTTGDADAFWNRRTELASIFAPDDSDFILRFDLGSGTRRHILGHALGFPMDTDPSKPNIQNVAIDIKCPDPAFFDPVGKSVQFSGSYSDISFQIPLSMPFGIGSSELNVNQSLTYNGNWRSYPHLIRVSGAITDPVITNESTGEKLDFTGITIGDGDYYDIDLRYSYKTVKNAAGTNKIGDLTTDSDLGSWHLGCPPEIAGGINSISATGSSINSNTKILIQYYEHYLSA